MNHSYGRQPHMPQGSGAANIVGRSGALLIDFDNVTLGAHGDLGRELQALLNSEVFRGKIAVRRAYGDWRRYPNYVVPLTEANIDLIFAPAWGSSKKNTTDLRMSVDAMELAFTRPEIGTFILLTGDSDFSSCVMKLKEYGKYVIGVGMRESASDLIVKNCDEYYSYHALTGLTRAAVGEGPTEDPWVLVGQAARRMAERGDSMRVDRLKQVMIEMDPGFDEREAGFGKFSKFVQRASERGLIRLRRDDAGQFSVIPVGEDELEESPLIPSDRRERERDRDRGRGRGRGRGRERDRGPRLVEEPQAPEPIQPEPERVRPEPAPEPVAAAPSEPAAAPAAPRGRGRGRGRAEGAPPILPGQVVSEGGVAPEAPAAEQPAAEAPAAPAPEAPAAPAPTAPAAPAPAAPAAPAGDPLRQAYGLLQQAVRDLTERRGERVRDGDIKRRMMEIQPGFDEGPLGFSKFTRFLRQAHDAGAVDLTRVAEGRYEASLPSGGGKFPAPSGAAGAPPATRPAPAEAEPAAEAPRDRGRRGRGRGAPEGAPPILPGQTAGEVAAQPAAEPAPAAPAAPVAAPPVTQPLAAEAAPRPLRGGRGGRGMPSGPPPILPGQVVQLPGSTPAVAETAPAAEPAPVESAPVAMAEAAPAAALPTEREAIVEYLSRYRGVGRKTVESLADTFGGDVFRALEEDPDAVRSRLGKRAEGILEQWASDPNRAAAVPAAEPEPEPASDEEGRPGRRSRGRRGGRGRGRGRSGEVAALADAVAGDTDPTLMGDVSAPAPEAAVEETASAAADAVVGDTDPSLVPEVVTEEGGAARRGRRGRRGGRGRGRSEGEAEQPIAAAKPETTDTDPSLIGAAALEEPAARPKGRGRGRGAAAAEPQPVAEPAPAPRKGGARKAAAKSAPPAAPAKKAGRSPARKAAAPPAPEPTPETPVKRGARGRVSPAKMPAGEAPEPIAPVAAPQEGAEARRRRRGGRGRGRGTAGE